MGARTSEEVGKPPPVQPIDKVRDLVHLPPPRHQQALSCATADPGLRRSHLPLPALEHSPNDVAR